MCEGRTDEVALNLKARIIFAGDIRAAEAKYHRQCYQTFKVSFKPEGTGKNPRNLDELNENGFCQLCSWLKTEDGNDGQYTFEDWRKKLTTFLPEDVPAYSVKHLKRRLVKYSNDKITVTECPDSANMRTFKDAAANMLHES